MRMRAPKAKAPEPLPPFARNLLRIRERMDLGQVAFADYLDVSQQTISLWERGLRQPGKRTWTLLEQRLGYSRVELESASLEALPALGVRETLAASRSLNLPPPREGFPVTHLGLDGLLSEAVDLGTAQRRLREAIRKGRPVWLVIG